MGLPKQGFVQQCYSLHLIYDAVSLGGLAGEGLSQGDVLGVVGFAENLSGRRSGLQPVAAGGASYSAVVARPQGAPYSDTGAAGVVYAAASLTDAAKAWPVNGLVGRLITSVAAGVVTTAVVTSNTATVLSFAAWSNGTPANGTVYVVAPPAYGPVFSGKGLRPAAQGSDNYYQSIADAGPGTEAV